MTVPSITDEKYIKGVLKRRPADSHKGMFGKILVIAGSSGMAGAAVFAGRAALRAGAGLTRYYVPKELFPVLQSAVPEATCIERRFPLEGVAPDDYDAIAIGPGLGRGEAVLLGHLLENYSGKLVIDADGLNTVSDKNLFSLMRGSSADIVISPHLGEAARLLDTTVAKLKERSYVSVAEELCEKTGAVVILKGHETLILSGDRAAVNHTGTPAMAKGGSGDVLTGIVTAFCGQGLSAFDAAKAGVYIHGLSGEEAEKETGSYGMTATDMIGKTGIVIERFL